jgi:hypothetical protein
MRSREYCLTGLRAVEMASDSAGKDPFEAFVLAQRRQCGILRKLCAHRSVAPHSLLESIYCRVMTVGEAVEKEPPEIQESLRIAWFKFRSKAHLLFRGAQLSRSGKGNRQSAVRGAGNWHQFCTPAKRGFGATPFASLKRIVAVQPAFSELTKPPTTIAPLGKHNSQQECNT